MVFASNCCEREKGERLMSHHMANAAGMPAGKRNWLGIRVDVRRQMI